MHRCYTIGLLTLLLYPCAFAHIRNVPQDFQTIQMGIDSAADHDTVLVQPGNYRENLNIFDKSVVLGSLTLVTGDPIYVDSTVIDGARRSSVITIASGDNREAVIHGFTLTGGLTPEDGGGIRCTSYGLLDLEDMLFTGNAADDGIWSASGGGLSARSVARVLLNRVTITGNLAQGGNGGGVDFWSVSDAVLTDCIIAANQSLQNGGGIYSFQSNLTMTRVLIAHNTAVRTGGGGLMHFEGAAHWDHVTIAGNSAGYYGGALAARGDEGSLITNSIIYGNMSGAGDSLIYLYSPLNFTFCDVEGATERMEGNPGVYENNIDQDPSFVDPGADDYHITENSPCVDAGDPESEADKDWTRTDMGAFPFIHRGAFIGGIVLDDQTGRPIFGAEFRAMDVIIDEIATDIVMRSDRSGLWGGWLNIAFHDTIDFEFEVTAPEHGHDVINALLAPGDSLWIEERLAVTGFVPSEDSISVALDSTGSVNIPVSIQNDGDGMLHWSADTRIAGADGSAPWTLRQNIHAGQITDDDRIEGVVFVGENFYASGSNGDANSLIYVINREGALIDSFTQAGSSRYGMKDLEWDGDLIWGSGDSIVYGFDREGVLQRSWRGPVSPTNCIAYDPVDGVLWMSGTTTSILGYDLEGNALNRALQRKSLRIYGLAWNFEDPDGYCLYILSRLSPDLPPTVYKMNAVTGDTVRVADIAVPPGCTGVGGGFICDFYDHYRSAIFTFTVNVPPDSGGDLIHVLQLKPNEEWLTVNPAEGDVPPGESRQVEVIIRTVALDHNWAFATGVYDGEIVFTHDGEGGRMILPVHLTVGHPNAIEPLQASVPTDFGFTSLYPQPFNSTLTLVYRLDAGGLVSLTLTDIMGREVLGRTGVPPVSSAYQSAGEHRVSFDATGLASGVYLARLEAGGRHTAVKIVCLK